MYNGKCNRNLVAAVFAQSWQTDSQISLTMTVLARRMLVLLLRTCAQGGSKVKLLLATTQHSQKYRSVALRGRQLITVVYCRKSPCTVLQLFSVRHSIIFIAFSKEQACPVGIATNTINIMNIISISIPPTRWLNSRPSGRQNLPSRKTTQEWGPAPL